MSSLPVARRLLRWSSIQPLRCYATAPSKESMLSLDWMLEGLLPNFMKNQMAPLFGRLTPNVTVRDDLYGYNLQGISQINLHLMKVRTYLRYKSPYCKMEYQGAYFYEGENVLTMLWKLSRLKSNFFRYFPKFLTGIEPTYLVREGALELHVNDKGMIYQMVNRKITEQDREAAKELAELKRKQEEEELKAEKDINDAVVEQYYRDKDQS